MPTIAELYQIAGQRVNEARQMIEAADKEKRSLTAEEQTKFDSIMAEYDGLKAQVERRARVDDAHAHVQGHEERQVPADRETEQRARENANQEKPDEKRHRAFLNYIRGGLDEMPREDRATLQADNDIGGGFFASSERFVNTMLKAADDILAVRQIATTFTLGAGESLGAPYLTAGLGDMEFGAGELTSAAEDTALEIGKRELKPRDIKGKLIKVSEQLIKSSRLDIEGLIANRIAYSYAACCESAFMTGTGAGQPLGLFTASDNGIGTARDVNIGSTTNFTADGMFTVQGTLKPAYQPKAKWLFHRDAITLLRKLKHGDGTYIWQPGLQLNVPDLILGKPYVTSEKVPHTFTSALYGGMYGDFSYYWIADSGTMSIKRLVELYSLTGQIGLLVRDLKCDAMPVLGEAFVRIKMSA